MTWRSVNANPSKHTNVMHRSPFRAIRKVSFMNQTKLKSKRLSTYWVSR